MWRARNYKGDEANPQLQRVYGTAFKTKKELDDYFAMLDGSEEARPSEARTRTRALVFDDDVGPGGDCSWRAALSSPKNWKKLRKKQSSGRLSRVRTPHIRSGSLYKKSATSLLRGVDVPPMRYKPKAKCSFGYEDRATRRHTSKKTRRSNGPTQRVSKAFDASSNAFVFCATR